MMKIFIINLLILIPVTFGNLQISGKHFTQNGQKVFLSGVNFAWNQYARDFGSGQYNQSKAIFEGWLANVASAGGNVVRVWLHVDGQWSPKFDGNGMATGTDTNSLIKELGQFLKSAQKYNIFVIICLWNGAIKPTPMINLYSNEAALESYLTKVLEPMVKALAKYKSLAAWEIINEPEGSLQQGITDNSNECFDTNKLNNSGSNWSGANLKMKEVLRFINRHASAIHLSAPGTLVTNGEWNEVSVTGPTTTCPNCFNYYKNDCLIAAGGQTKGYLDFYQVHTYTYQGKYTQNSVMKNKFEHYKCDKPLIIGEFSTACSESTDPAVNYKHAYKGDFAGVLAWQYNEGGDCTDKKGIMNKGMTAIKNMKGNGMIKIKIK